MRRPQLVRFALALSAVLGMAGAGLGAATAATAASTQQQRYAVDGMDSFRTGNAEAQTEIRYSGEQTLTIEHIGPRTTRYTAHVEYVRIDGAQRRERTASFTSTELPSGEQRDSGDDDPDYLTVLNQPFAVQLDPATLRDLDRLRRAVPFTFPSPMTGAPLHGYLERLGPAVVAGRRALGVKFNADGPMEGSLPDHGAGLSLAGRIRMTGTAYYRFADGLLAALDATLTIAGNLRDAGRNIPVTIVYRRSLRAEPDAAR